MEQFKKILIAVDDSAESMAAARTGFALAHELNATVGILCVVDPSREMVNADQGITPEESKTLLLQQAEKTIRQYIELYNGAGEVYRFTPEGAPEEVILHIAHEWQAQLIVMGTHGRSGLNRMMEGSVADHVIRHAEVPVLVTPPGLRFAE
jgi:nucleotide-binding universal stress UspA family protein